MCFLGLPLDRDHLGCGADEKPSGWRFYAGQNGVIRVVKSRVVSGVCELGRGGHSTLEHCLSLDGGESRGG